MSSLVAVSMDGAQHGHALFSLTPDGTQDMVAICEESGADVAAATVLQFLRYLTVPVLVPAMVGWLFS